MHRWLTCALFLLVFPVAGAQQPPAELSRIQGAVFDAITRAPIPAVRVTGPGVQVTGPSIEVVIATDANGLFVVENVYPGRVLVTFRKPGYVAQTVPYDFIAGRGIENANIFLAPTGIVTGRVTNPQGEPAANVEVTLLGYRARTQGREMVRFAVSRTDDRGEYRLVDVPSGRYLVAFGTVFPVDDTSGPKRIFPTVYPGDSDFTKAGTIEMRGGEELRLNNVRLESDQGLMSIHFINGPGESAKDVVFQIGYRTQFSDSTTAGAEDFAPIRLHIDAGESLSRTIWPGRFGVYILVVYWAAGDGSPQSIVTPVEFNGQSQSTDIVLTPPKGHLKIHAITQQSDGRTVPLGTARIGICHAALTACSSSGFWISKINATPTFLNTVQPVLGSDGFLDLPAVVPGQYELYSLTVPNGFFVATAHQGDRDALTDGILISEDSLPLEIEVRPNAGILRGSVNDKEGHAVQNAMVAVLPEPPKDRAKLQSLRRAVRTDPAGLFEVQNIIPGNYRVYAWSGVQDDAYLDGDFVARFKSFGVPVNVTTVGEMNLKVLNER